MALELSQPELMAMAIKTGVTSPVDNIKGLFKALSNLPRTDVLVGVPESKAERKPDEDDTSEPINNAALAYIHNFGAPEASIPARPFMYPGIRAAKAKIINYLGQAGAAGLDGDLPRQLKALNAAGMTATSSIKNKINTGPFEPLAIGTIRARAAKGRKGAQAYVEAVKAGEEPPADAVKPLVDTGQLRNSITYIVEQAK